MHIIPNAFSEKAMCSTPETKEVVENLKRKYPGSQNYNNFSIPVNKTISEDDQELVLKETIKKEEQLRSGAFDVLGDDSH